MFCDDLDPKFDAAYAFPVSLEHERGRQGTNGVWDALLKMAYTPSIEENVGQNIAYLHSLNL